MTSIGPKTPQLETYRFSHNGQSVQIQAEPEQIARLRDHVDANPDRTADGLPILSREELGRLVGNRDAAAMSAGELARALEISLARGFSARRTQQLASQLVDAQRAGGPQSPNAIRHAALSSIHQILLAPTDGPAERTLQKLGIGSESSGSTPQGSMGLRLHAVVALVESLALPAETKAGLLASAQNVRPVDAQGRAGLSFRDTYMHEVNALSSVPPGLANQVRSADVAPGGPRSAYGAQAYRFLEEAIARLQPSR